MLHARAQLLGVERRVAPRDVLHERLAHCERQQHGKEHATGAIALWMELLARDEKLTFANKKELPNNQWVHSKSSGQELISTSTSSASHAKLQLKARDGDTAELESVAGGHGGVLGCGDRPGHVVDGSGPGVARALPRILGGVVLAIAVIAPIMITLQGKGVTIETFLEGEKSTEQIKTLVDFYNSVTGSIGSLVFKPVDMFLGLFMAAAFLCLATNFTIDRGSGSHWQYLPLLTGAALAFLFSNGLNSLNVQVTPGALGPRISAEDLAAATNTMLDQPLINGSLATAWDTAFAESASGNSVFNKILRSKLLPQEVITSQCTSGGLLHVHTPIGEVSLWILLFSEKRS